MRRALHLLAVALAFLPAAFLAPGVAGADTAAAPGKAGKVTLTKGPWILRLTPNAALVRVEVDPPGPVTLELTGAGAPGGAPRILQSKETRALHSLLVEGLTPATRYAFAVKTAGGERRGALTTAPDPASAAPFRFLVYGDNRTDDAAHAAVVKAMAERPADFLVHTGDFVERGGSAANWQTFFEIEAPLLRDRCLVSCVGNHELVDGSGIQYARFFGPSDPVSEGDAGPGAGGLPLGVEHLNGTFRWSNTRFFMINGMVGYKAGASRAWLEKALADADLEAGLRWRIVVTHHGPWSSGPHGGNALFHEAGVPELLRLHEVDLVLAGHDHIYERGESNGLAYLVSGGGGAPTYKVKKPDPTSRKVESTRHFIEVSATEASLSARAIRPDGSVVDVCGLAKGRGWDCDGAAPATSATAASTSAHLDASPPASPRTTNLGPPPSATSSRCGCRAVGGAAGPWRQVEGVGLLGLLGTWLVRRRRSRAILGS